METEKLYTLEEAQKKGSEIIMKSATNLKKALKKKSSKKFTNV